ncbi:MAG: transcription antitermination factor NusB [Thermodesulfobacteriota bacterium]
MGYRRRSRELAMQALFFMDSNQSLNEEMVGVYCRNFPPPKKLLPFFLDLVNGVLRSKSQIDSIIERFSNNWKLNRMSCVDRNVIRIAVYEMFFRADIPPKVSINEAIDVGKKYGTRDSGSFINGILDSIRNFMEDQAADQAFMKTAGDLNTEQGGSF